MKINDRVKVDFVSESSTEFSGKRFTGEGVVDRVEDGRVFGRLDSGVPFVCDVSDAVVIEQQDKRKEDVARSAVVELFDLAKEQQAEIKQLKAQLNNMEACYIEKKKQVEAVEHILGCAMIGPKKLFNMRTELEKPCEVLMTTGNNHQ